MILNKLQLITIKETGKSSLLIGDWNKPNNTINTILKREGQNLRKDCNLLGFCQKTRAISYCVFHRKTSHTHMMKSTSQWIENTTLEILKTFKCLVPLLKSRQFLISARNTPITYHLEFIMKMSSISDYLVFKKEFSIYIILYHSNISL